MQLALRDGKERMAEENICMPKVLMCLDLRSGGVISKALGVYSACGCLYHCGRLYHQTLKYWVLSQEVRVAWHWSVPPNSPVLGVKPESQGCLALVLGEELPAY